MCPYGILRIMQNEKDMLEKKTKKKFYILLTVHHAMILGK